MFWSMLIRPKKLVSNNKIIERPKVFQIYHLACLLCMNLRGQLIWALFQTCESHYAGSWSLYMLFVNGMKILYQDLWTLQSIFAFSRKQSNDLGGTFWEASQSEQHLSKLIYLTLSKLLEWTRWLNQSATEVIGTLVHFAKHYLKVMTVLQFSHHYMSFSKCPFGWHLH